MLSVDFLFFIVLYVFNSAFFFFLSEEIRKTLQKEERNRCGRLLPAENMGIYCVSRIF
jgi:hypothetical protein